jgi:hypothetical protein
MTIPRAVVNSKLLLKTEINAQDEQYFGDGLHQLVDDMCHLDIECGRNMVVRVTVEHIEFEDNDEQS